LFDAGKQTKDTSCMRRRLTWLALFWIGATHPLFVHHTRRVFTHTSRWRAREHAARRRMPAQATIHT
jgi:hypothetical protein